MADEEASQVTTLVVRATPAKVANYRDYKQLLRVDFWYSCAYCTMTEVEAQGIRFTIDHYEAQVKVPEKETDYGNLLWACDPCNTFKGDLWPDDELTQAGLRFYRPDLDHPEHHFALKGQRVEGQSPIGEFTVEMLDLNREQLRRLRDLRGRLQSSSREILVGLRSLLDIPIDRLPRHVRSRFLELRGKLEGESGKLEMTVGDVVMALSKSIMLDTDLESRKRAKGRRQYLASVRALVAEADGGTAESESAEALDGDDEPAEE